MVGQQKAEQTRREAGGAGETQGQRQAATELQGKGCTMPPQQKQGCTEVGGSQTMLRKQTLGQEAAEKTTS